MFGILFLMAGEGGTGLSKLQGAISELQFCDSDVDPKQLRAAIDALEGIFSAVVKRAQERGDHLVDGNIGPASWVRPNSRIFVHSAPGQICGGGQAPSLPK